MTNAGTADTIATRINLRAIQPRRLQIKSDSVWLCVLLTVTVTSLASSCNSSLHPLDQFPVRKQARYFDFRYERNSLEINRRARFADGYINCINHDFFKADFDYPIRVFVLEDRSRFEKFVHRELRVPGPAGFGIYVYSKKLLATYEDSGLGTFTHETMHALVEKTWRIAQPGPTRASQHFSKSFTATGRTMNWSFFGAFRILGGLKSWELDAYRENHSALAKLPS